jgi:hypothetical protein
MKACHNTAEFCHRDSNMERDELAERVGYSPVRPVAGVFVGRQREMFELQSALHDALSGQGRVVALAGEPGIGKTRTVQK